MILVGNALDKLRDLADGSVDCCVSSPPYFGLRDYGTDPVWWPEVAFTPLPGLPAQVIPEMTCELGQEPTPEAFIGHLVLIYREVRRVLKGGGTAWLNMGDSYNGFPANRGTASRYAGRRELRDQSFASGNGLLHKGTKSKDLLGIPWRLAFALQADGWYLRQDVIWHKPNPMPESVTDRCTKAHEYVFLLTKQPRYFFDAEAISEPLSQGSHARLAQDTADQAGSERVPGETNGPMKAVVKGGNYLNRIVNRGSSFTEGKTGDHQQGRASTKPRLGSYKQLIHDVTGGPRRGIPGQADHKGSRLAALVGRTPGNTSHKGTEAYQGGVEDHRTKGGCSPTAPRARNWCAHWKSRRKRVSPKRTLTPCVQLGWATWAKARPRSAARTTLTRCAWQTKRAPRSAGTPGSFCPA